MLSTAVKTANFTQPQVRISKNFVSKISLTFLMLPLDIWVRILTMWFLKISIMNSRTRLNGISTLTLILLKNFQTALRLNVKKASSLARIVSFPLAEAAVNGWRVYATISVSSLIQTVLTSAFVLNFLLLFSHTLQMNFTRAKLFTEQKIMRMLFVLSV